MKTLILFFAVIFGYITPTYSQLNRYRKTDAPREQLQNGKHYDFGNYTFAKFSGSWRNSKFDSFNRLPTWPAPDKFTEEISSWGEMPCFYPKSEDKMPCFKPTDTFPMRVFKPENVIWGILW